MNNADRPFRPGLDPYRFVALATVEGEGDDVQIISETHVSASSEEEARAKVLRFFTTRYQWRSSTNQRAVLLPLQREGDHFHSASLSVVRS